MPPLPTQRARRWHGLFRCDRLFRHFGKTPECPFHDHVANPALSHGTPSVHPTRLLCSNITCAKNLFVNPPPNPTPIQASAPDIARRVGLIVAGLAALVAKRFLHDPHLVLLIVPLWTRLTRTARRFERLMARLAANRLSKPRPPKPHRPTPDTPRPATPFPTGHAWLIRALPHEAAAYAGQLDALLAEPGTADLLAACPAAARILRPLSRMLGLRALAPTRVPRKRRTQAASPGAAPGRAPVPWVHPDPSYRPSANWPRGPWPTAHHPGTKWWPPGRPRRAAPA